MTNVVDLFPAKREQWFAITHNGKPFVVQKSLLDDIIAGKMVTINQEVINAILADWMHRVMREEDDGK